MPTQCKQRYASPLGEYNLQRNVEKVTLIWATMTPGNKNKNDFNQHQHHLIP
jgi:hypothetical protein